VIAVAGQPQKKLDASGTYKQACALLAKDLGWKLDEIYAVWRQIAMLREFECRWPRACAEMLAMQDTIAVFAKQGQEGD
jgi:hypothetical protein